MTMMVPPSEETPGAGLAEQELIVPIEFGTMCRVIARLLRPPMTFTAWTYSLVRRVSVSPRMSRATPSQ